MKTFYGFDALPKFVRPVVTIGSYDGVHKGHKELLARTTDLALQTGGESVVITFSPHPRVALSQGTDNVPLLNTVNEKELLLAAAGVDNLIIAPFTEAFSQIEYSDFIKDYLVDKVELAALVVGFNHRLGHDHQGDFRSISQLSNQYNFAIYEVPQYGINDLKISSTTIRNLICKGDMKWAADLLGYRYFAKMSGLPNPITDDPAKLMPPAGIYTVSLYSVGSVPSTETLTGTGILKLAYSHMHLEISTGAAQEEFILEFC